MEVDEPPQEPVKQEDLPAQPKSQQSPQPMPTPLQSDRRIGSNGSPDGRREGRSDERARELVEDKATRDFGYNASMKQAREEDYWPR